MYGEEKRLDMARSVLPSTYRAAARKELRRIARAQRRATRQAVRRLAVAADDLTLEALEARLVDIQLQRCRDLDDAVGWRRTGDKVGPLIRWAPRATVDLRIQDRLPTVRAWLPANLIGRHAVSHVQWAEGMSVDFDHERYFERALPSGPNRDEIVGRVVEIIAGGRHAELNRRIRAACGVVVDGSQIASMGRLLSGLHDVDAFVAVMIAERQGRIRWYRGESWTLWELVQEVGRATTA